MKICIFVLLSLAVAATPALAVEIPVFVVAGQSNAVGFTTDSTLLPDSLKAVQPNVLYHGNPDWPLYMSNWAPLLPPTQYGQTISGHAFGPEITIGKTISDARGGQLVAMAKFASIASNLFNDWNPNTPDKQYNLYKPMVDKVKGLVAKLPTDSPGNTGKVAGFFWMQGEADGAPYWWDSTDDGVDNETLHAQRTTAEYQTDLTDFIAHVRADFGDPNLPFVFGRITTTWGDHHSVRDAQANVAATVPNTFMVDTDTFGTDGYHYTNQGTIDLGIGFGNGYLSITPEPSTLVLLAMGALGFLAWAWRQRRA